MGHFKETIFYIIVSVAAFLGTMIFTVLRRPKKVVIPIAQGDMSGSDNSIEANSTRALKDDPILHVKPKSDFIYDIKETAKLMVTRKMMLVIPFIIWSALSQSIISGCFVPMMNETMKDDYPTWSDNTKLEYALYAMVPLGVGEVIGSLYQGFIADRHG